MNKLKYLSVIFTITVLLIFCNGIKIHSQEKTILVNSGLHYDMISITQNQREYFKQRIDGLSPSFELSWHYVSKQGFLFKTGLSYSNFGHNIGIKDLNGRDFYHGTYFDMFKFISLSTEFGYSLQLFKHFNLNFSSGIAFSYLFHQVGGTLEGYYWNPYENLNQRIVYTMNNCLQQKYNISISNRVQLSYKTKRNICYNLHCSYNAGLFHIWEETARLEINDASEIFEPTFTSRGSYWNFGLGVGYVFRKTSLNKTTD